MTKSESPLSKIVYPIASKKDYNFKHLGVSFEDPWFWLRNKEEAAVREYLEQENKATDEFLADTQDLQKLLFEELKGRIAEVEDGVPVQRDHFEYSYRYVKGGQHPIYWRRDLKTGKEEVLLNLNELAQGQKYLQLGVYDVSPNHEWLAYSLDTDGSESFTIHFKNLKSGEVLSDRITGTYYSSAWNETSDGLFYTRLDENHRPLFVYFHKLNTLAENDELVYAEKYDGFFVSVDLSLDGKWVMIESDGNNQSEIRVSRSREKNFKLVEPRSEGHEYSLQILGEEVWIRTNKDGALDFKLMKTHFGAIEKQNWKDVFPAKEKQFLKGFLLLDSYAVLSVRSDGLDEILVMNRQTQDLRKVTFPEEVRSVGLGQVQDPHSATFRYTYSSLTQPTQIYDQELSSGHTVLRKTQQIPSGFDASEYESKRIWATSHDGVRIPISLFYKKGLQCDSTHPLMLYGYGSYGSPSMPGFRTSVISLVDRDYVFAIAHIRGGTELGRNWYEDGKLLKKKNTFYDFIACAEELISQGYTSIGKIVAHGGSAGGLLMGAVANMRPDLWGAILAQVPFVDVVNTMLDDTLPLTKLEYNEWGNPHDPQYFHYIHSYSPYDQVERKDYPPMFIVGGWSDPRVTYWEPAKWAAKLREYRTNSVPLLLKIHMESGHGGASGRFDILKEIAMMYAFILKVVK